MIENPARAWRPDARAFLSGGTTDGLAWQRHKPRKKWGAYASMCVRLR